MSDEHAGNEPSHTDTGPTDTGHAGTGPHGGVPGSSGHSDTVYTEHDEGWHAVDAVPATGAVWVVVGHGEALRDLAQAYGVSAQALRMLDAHPLSPESHDDSWRHLRGRVNRSNDGEILLSVPTASYVESTRDVVTGVLTCLVTDRLILTCERGDAGVLQRAAEKLCDGLPVPDTGVRQVLAAILLTLVNRASDVEAGLGDAVAQLEQLVVEPGPGPTGERASGDRATGTKQTGNGVPGQDALGAIYRLKREIAEARRALGPMTTALPELEAETQDVHGTGLLHRRADATTAVWLRRVRERSDRIDAHLDSHDELLDAMLSVYLSNVSVRQNEDMRKISAWAAMITVPTLIAGIYGMNFQHMPELGWRFGYPLVLVVMAGACTLLFRAFRRSGWL